MRLNQIIEILEAKGLGARITEAPVKTREVEKSKEIAWKHFLQFWYVIKGLVFN